MSEAVSHTFQQAHEHVDAVADRATELIGNAAGAVADPATGMKKLKAVLTKPSVIVVIVVGAIVVAMALRLRHSS